MKKIYYQITMLFFVFSIGMLIFDKLIMPFYIRENLDRNLPNVKGYSFVRAKETLESEGFHVKKGDIKYTNKFSEGTVIDQFPGPSRRVKPGRTIHLTIAQRERMVLIPDLIGKSIRSGRLELSDSGLLIDTLITEFDPDIPIDVIRWQYPRAGDYLRKGSGLKIIISKGKPPNFYEVPQLFGLSMDKGEKLLNKSKLYLGKVNYRQNEDLVPYTILEQSIVSGTILDKPQSIDVTVSILELDDLYNQLTNPIE
tara:strand:+ start:51 stop:812 length:762 start_codon:yes stop_codon:yes gene_type:complete